MKTRIIFFAIVAVMVSVTIACKKDNPVATGTLQITTCTAGDVTPVSYTHLDVYKRQFQYLKVKLIFHKVH